MPILATHSYAASCKVNDVNISAEYSGECKDGFANGKGIAKGKSSYAGEFINGNRSGIGAYMWANGDHYVGRWVDDKKTQGTFTWANGDRYNGSWLDNNRSGYGRMISTKQSSTNIENWMKNKIGSWQGDFYVVEGIWKNDQLIKECKRSDCDLAMIPKK